GPVHWCPPRPVPALRDLASFRHGARAHRVERVVAVQQRHRRTRHVAGAAPGAFGERGNAMMQVIELEDVDALGAGAVGPPGQRVFYIQARTESAQLTVVVEKEQVALLAAEAVAFLDRIAADYPEPPASVGGDRVELREPTVPLFRARLIGLGF